MYKYINVISVCRIYMYLECDWLKQFVKISTNNINIYRLLLLFNI